MIDECLGMDAGARHILKVIVASLALPLHRELQRRILEIYSLPATGREGQNERRQLREWLDGMRKDVERVVVEDATLMCECIRDVPSLAVLTHLACPPLHMWAEYLISVRDAEAGGLMPRVQRRQALET